VKVEKGYICLDPAYVSENPSFSLQVLGFEPRYLSPHPYTNQRTLTLARGPIVYCVEDADNPWETNHFKDVFLRTDSKVAEKMVTDEKTGEEYVSLQSKCWKQSISTHASLKVDGDSAAPRDLVFVPYYLRANRGGKGQMRVGLINGGIESGVIFPERL
jgi:DUF1680 family protein